MYFLVHCIGSLEKCLFISFDHFKVIIYLLLICKSSLYFGNKYHIRYMILKYFCFYLFHGIICSTEIFDLGVVQFIYFFPFVTCICAILFNKPVSNPRSQRFTHMSSKTLVSCPKNICWNPSMNYLGTGIKINQKCKSEVYFLL
jgi:hypothetical protein